MQQEQMMGKNNKKCPRCGHKMMQQFIDSVSNSDTEKQQ